MTSSLQSKLFNAADSLRSKMDASEYKNYLLGLIFYKYLSDKQLVKVVDLHGESLNVYDTQEKQEILYRELLRDKNTHDDLKDALESVLGYLIEPDYLFSKMSSDA